MRSKIKGVVDSLMSCREHYILKCLIDEIPQGQFTDWEETFIESVNKQLKAKGELTDRQKEILERIFGD